MKKLIGAVVVAVAMVFFAAGAYAVDQTLTSSVTASVGTVFALEFYTEAGKVLYSTSVPFSSVDPTNAYNYPDGRAEGDLKADVGLVVKTNQDNSWYLKINLDAGSGLLGALRTYLGQPYNRNLVDTPTTGTRPFGDNWFLLTSSAATMYNGSAAEKINTPNGTLATLSYSLDGTLLSPGGFSGTVTYTLSTTP